MPRRVKKSPGHVVPLRDRLRLFAEFAILAALAASSACGGGGSDDSPSVGGSIPVVAGCYSSSYAGAGNGAIGCGSIATFGNPTLDTQFLQEIQLQNQFWTGLPTYVYAFDECTPAARNAISMPSGLILFGRWLSASVVQTQGSSAALSGIMAHEWAHQAQFRFGWVNNSQSTQRNSELEADAFGGYFMILGKGFPSSVVDQYFNTLEGMGDFNFNSPGHHGTPTQRHAAGAIGVAVALNIIATQTPLTYNQLHSTFYSQVSALSRIADPIQSASLNGITDLPISEEHIELLRRVAAGQARISDFSFAGARVEDLRSLWPTP